ncbi:MAG: hypothetical protein V4739_04220 [Pseudomonadota bacterium]
MTTPVLDDVSQLPLSFGALKPVGHVIVGLEDDATAERMRDALKEEGCNDTVLQVPAKDMAQALEGWLAHASGTSEFGTESDLMRRYQVLAEAGCGWLVVPASDEESEQRVAEVARRFNARFANKYGRLIVEDLL